MSKSWFTSAFGEGKALSRSKSENLSCIPKGTTKRKITKTSTQQDLDSSSENEDLVVVDDGIRQKRLKAFQSTNWLKTFAPTSTQDLAIHPKKLQELQGWFKLVNNGSKHNRILLIIGPTGSAKTTSLKLVAKDCEFDIAEFINSTDVESSLYYENSTKFNNEYTSSYENQVNKFSDFIFSTSRFPSLFSNIDRLVMVKDLPNKFLKKTDEFWDILRKFSSEGLSPLVFVITDTNSKSLNVAYNLFPESIRNELAIDAIEFNPIAVTLMKKGVKRIRALIESNVNYSPFYKHPSEEVVDSIIEQSQGDIRNAILNLNFACQQSDFKMTVVQSIKTTKKTGKKQKTSMKPKKSDGGIGKNENISLMHGLGRVFHPKYETGEKSKINTLTHQPETITESFRSQPANFIEMISSNYFKMFGEIDDIASTSDILSLSDCFQTEYRDEQLHQLNLNLVIRAAMVLNAHPGSGGFRAIGGYANKKFKAKQQQMDQDFIAQSKGLNNGNMMGRNDFFCDYKSFVKIIN